MRLFLILFFCCLFHPFLVFAEESVVDLCDDVAVEKQVSSYMLDINQSKQAVAIARQVELGVKKGFVKPGYRDEMLEAALEYYLRKTNQCEVPPTLNARVSTALSLGKADGEFCEVGQFEKAVNRQFETLKSSGGYEVFEGMVKAQVANLIVEPASDVFVQRWDEESGFREKSIRAGLEMGVMQVSGCSNPEAPILLMIAEF